MLVGLSFLYRKLLHGDIVYQLLEPRKIGLEACAPVDTLQCNICGVEASC